jgi:beta-1,4-mannosyl-glycoprotein beta-1,4-N-acetylglucosaminyltransferase|tara:strand:- start:3173 stop:4057 length:885 start_codon:yes stop_codon:yes gene_type:complete
MKIFDCTTYFDEDLLMDVRFNILGEKVEKFIVVESCYSHSGKKKELNFNINNYKKFKDKIIYIVIENEPDEINRDKNLKSIDKRANSLKRIDQSYEFMMKGIDSASNNDLIILSDNDEIPNLNSDQFLKSKSDILIFKQLFFYYKFDLLYDAMPWHGSKACKKNKLLSMPWLRNLKNKKYPLWRLDTFFSNTKYSNLEIINDGGWHFTNLKSAEDLFNKMKNGGHHNEFEDNNINIEFIKEKINNHEVFYNHFLDQTDPNKWNNNYKLKPINVGELPDYISKNKDQFSDWFSKN